MRIGRRGLLGLRPTPPAPAPAPPPPPPPSFSLDDFYARRARQGAPSEALPSFELRPGLPSLASLQTTVGVPGYSPRRAAPDAAPAPARRKLALLSPLAPLPRPPHIRPSLCLAWGSSPCVACLDACPIEGALVVEEQRPRVAEERCTSCGMCVLACPAPVNAFATPEP